MNIYMEHANIHVGDVDGLVDFLQKAFPSFKVRHDSGRDDVQRWVHLGDDNTYLSIYRATASALEPWTPYSGRPGLNHIGFVVDDVDTLRRRLLDAGYRETTVPNEHPARKRVYFNDPEGNDWEFVEYTTDDPSRRNDYSLDEQQ